MPRSQTVRAKQPVTISVKEEGDEGEEASAGAEEEQAGEGEEEVEHLLDGEGPEHGPAGREVALHVRGFVPVEGEGEGGEERAGEGGVGLVDGVALDVQEVQDAEDGQQEQEQGADAGEADAVEGAGNEAGEEHRSAEGRCR